MLISSYTNRSKISAENRRKGLETIYVADFVSAKSFSGIMERSLSGSYKLLGQLKDLDLVKCQEVNELKTQVWYLTREGLAQLAFMKNDDSILLRDPRINRVSALTLAHELMLQELHAKSLKHHITNWVYGRSLKGKLLKRPDAVFRDSRGCVVALEGERFAKSKQRVSGIISSYLQEISAGKYQRIHYVAPTESQAWSLKRLFYSIREIEVSGQLYSLEPKHYERFEFYEVDCWPNRQIEG